MRKLRTNCSLRPFGEKSHFVSSCCVFACSHPNRYPLRFVIIQTLTLNWIISSRLADEYNTRHFFLLFRVLCSFFALWRFFHMLFSACTFAIWKKNSPFVFLLATHCHGYKCFCMVCVGAWKKKKLSGDETRKLILQVLHSSTAILYLKSGWQRSDYRNSFEQVEINFYELFKHRFSCLLRFPL